MTDVGRKSDAILQLVLRCSNILLFIFEMKTWSMNIEQVNNGTVYAHKETFSVLFTQVVFTGSMTFRRVLWSFADDVNAAQLHKQ
jgi:hypothetical protein